MDPFLERKNPHARDQAISFEEGPHIYTIKGKSDYLSVTKWVHSHFPSFNADEVIHKMMSSKKWGKSIYYGKTRDEIKEIWKKKGKKASALGTKLHYDIECFWNKVLNKNDTIEFQYFLNFTKRFSLNPYRTEWMIWDDRYKFAGSIDMLFENVDGTLDIYDWKRCKNIRKANMFESASTECISHLPNSNYWHYTLQLNTYKKILELNYDKKIKNMYLICLHPIKDNFQRLKVPSLDQEMSELFDDRLKKLKSTDFKNVKALL